MDECFIKKENSPVITLVKNEYQAILKVFAFYAFIQTSFYLLFVWMPSYLNIYLGLPHKTSFLLASLGLGLQIIFTLIFGYTAEKFGRKNLVLFSIISVMVLVYPAFVIISYKYLPTIFLVLFVFALCFGCINGVMMAIVGDLFPSGIRCSGISISFTFATALFGGTAPTICSYLINKTGYTLSPVFFIMVVCLAALPAAISLEK